MAHGYLQEISVEEDGLMVEVHWERYPQVSETERVRTWLQIQANLGLAANTVDAYRKRHPRLEAT